MGDAAVVHEIVQRATCFCLDALHRCSYARRGCHVKGEKNHVGKLLEMRHLGSGTCCGEDQKAALLEPFYERRSYATGAASCDEDGFWGRHGSWGNGR